MTTRAVSSAGTPTNNSPMARDCHAAFALDNPIIASAATAKPIGMLPPSPRKMRAGDERLWGRKPRHAPQSVAATTASQVSPCAIPSSVMPPATTAAMVVAAPSMLSKRLKALTTATTQNPVTSRSTAEPSPRFQPRSLYHRNPASASSTATRLSGLTVRRSSTVPTNHSTTTPIVSGTVRRQSPVRARVTATNPRMTAAPPRYGVGAACPLYPAGRS
jgi:hypothetical protein